MLGPRPWCVEFELRSCQEHAALRRGGGEGACPLQLATQSSVAGAAGVHISTPPQNEAPDPKFCARPACILGFRVHAGTACLSCHFCILPVRPTAPGLLALFPTAFAGRVRHASNPTDVTCKKVAEAAKPRQTPAKTYIRGKATLFRTLIFFRCKARSGLRFDCRSPLPASAKKTQSLPNKGKKRKGLFSASCCCTPTPAQDCEYFRGLMSCCRARLALF